MPTPPDSSPRSARQTEAGSTRTALQAGVLDAWSASLATFVSGLFAARFLEPGDLGGYALAFGAFIIATIVPAQLVFVPSEVAAVSYPRSGRLALVRQTVRLGLGPAALCALGVGFWALIAPPNLSPEVITGLTVTAALAAFLSPVQDHVRRMLHSSGRSKWAAAVSCLHLVTVLVAILGLSSARIPPWWIPFGSLALGNLVSLAVGLQLCRRAGGGVGQSLGLSLALRSGRWLLLLGLLPNVAALVCAGLLAHLAGSESLGYVEAARVLGQPIWVLAIGLSAVLGPASMEAAKHRQLQKARQSSQKLMGVVGVSGLLYLAVAFDWPENPLRQLLPSAYAVPYLLAATILGNTLNGLVFSYRAELFGGGRETTLVKIEATGNLARIGLAATAGLTGCFAIPAGMGALGVARWWGYRKALKPHYTTGVAGVA